MVTNFISTGFIILEGQQQHHARSTAYSRPGVACTELWNVCHYAVGKYNILSIYYDIACINQMSVMLMEFHHN